VSCAGPPECHLLLAAWRPRRTPLEQPLDATPPLLFFLLLLFVLSPSRELLPVTELGATAVASRRRSASPRPSLSSPPAPPRLPRPPRPRNRPETPGVAAAVAVPSAVTELAAAKIRRHRHLSSRATTSGEPRVSWRTPWTFFPFPLMAGAAAREPAGSLLAMAELPSSWPAWPVCRWAMGPSVRCLGQLGPGEKSSCALFLFLEFQNLIKTCKRHIYLSVNQKNMYEISKCSEK
jgi:hypothetical protein